MYEEALVRGQEYAGRQDTTLDGEKKITEIDKIPGVPYNLNPSANVEEQEHSAECRQMAIECVVSHRVRPQCLVYYRLYTTRDRTECELYYYANG